MVKKSLLPLRGSAAMLVLLSILAAIMACSTGSAGPGSRPRRKFIPPEIVRPRTVESTWHFETIFSPQKFQLSGQDWLAVDSLGHPALAYGGNQLHYSWFDGSAWQVETIDSRPGAGRFAQLLFDAHDRPHIVYASGGTIDLRLDSMYRDADGWHHETIDPGACIGRNLDTILDPLGNVLVAYEVDLHCGFASNDGPQIRLARRTENGWLVTVVGQDGRKPSLVMDREGQLHVGYLHSDGYALVEKIYQADGTWQANRSLRFKQFSHASDLLIDAQRRPHWIYWLSGGPASTDSIYHSWLGENGWQTEEIGPASELGLPPAVVMDSQDRIYVLGTGDSLKILRRDADGWQKVQTLDQAGGIYPGLSLTLDRNEQIHAAYFKMPDYAIYYAVQQDGTWKIDQVDQGNEPIYFETNVAMAYDRLGQLHVSFYDARYNVHYLSETASGWQDEVAAQPRYQTFPISVELALDLEDKPHIFYVSNKTLVNGNAYQLEHAFQEKGHWVSRDVPFDPGGEGFERSPIALDHEGWPAFLEDQDTGVRLHYRTPEGWRLQILEDLDAFGSTHPQIAFPEEAVSGAADPGGILPSIFYFDTKSNVLTFRAAGQKRPLVVPILDQNEIPGRLAMRQLEPRSEMFLVVSGRPSKEHPGAPEGFLRYAIHRNGNWKVFELDDLYSPAISNQSIGPDGSIQMAEIDYSQKDTPIYYLEGHDSVWKKTKVTGYDTRPYEFGLLGMTRNPNGPFCLLLADYRANSLVLGCLDSLHSK